MYEEGDPYEEQFLVPTARMGEVLTPHISTTLPAANSLLSARVSSARYQCSASAEIDEPARSVSHRSHPCARLRAVTGTLHQLRVSKPALQGRKQTAALKPAPWSRARSARSHAGLACLDHRAVPYQHADRRTKTCGHLPAACAQHSARQTG